MKPLILLTLIFSTVATAQAQTTLADLARQVRKDRVGQPQATKVIKTEDIRSQGTAPAPSVATPPRPVAENPTPAPATAEKAATPGIDPVQKWVDEANKARAKVQSLKDQETANQAEINKVTADINAPVTSQSAKDEAQKKLEAAQKKQVTIKSDIEKAQEEVRALDQQGPPVRKP